MGRTSCRRACSWWCAHPLAVSEQPALAGRTLACTLCRTMHEKMLYIEALRKGWEALGRTCHVTNMARLEKQPSSMPASGVTLVLGESCALLKEQPPPCNSRSPCDACTCSPLWWLHCKGASTELCAHAALHGIIMWHSLASWFAHQVT